MSVHNYTKFSFSYGGVSARKFAEGDALTVSYVDDEVEAYTGTRGEGALVVGSSNVAEINVKLQGTSEEIAQYIALDRAAKLAGTCGLPFIAKVRSGEQTFTTAGTALLKKRVDFAASDSMMEIDLEFLSSDAVQVVA